MLGKSVQTLARDGIFDTVLNPRILREKKPATAIQKVTNGRQLALSGHPVFDEKGAVAYVVIFIRDITAPSNLKKEIARQKELLATFQSMDKEENGGTPPVVESADASRVEFNPIDLEGKTYKEIMRECGDTAASRRSQSTFR